MRAFGWGLLLVLASEARGEETPLTLDAGLSEARRSSPPLAASRLDAQASNLGVDEARGQLWPALSVSGDVHGGYPSTYASGDARLQLVAAVPLYAGGRVRSEIEVNRADAEAARAALQLSERDLDLEVRSDFAEHERAVHALEIRRAGIDRLRAYLVAVEARLAAGLGGAADLAKTRVRLGQEEADITDARAQVAAAALELNILLGRPADAPLVLAPLSPPSGLPPRTDTNPQPPELEQAEAAARAASAQVGVARADRGPTIALTANVGAEPVLGSSNAAPLNTGEGWGGEATLTFDVPLLDAGVLGSRVARARLMEQAAWERVRVAQRTAMVAWRRAVVELDGLRPELQIRARTVDLARDAWLQAEALYRGGAGTALDVLDSHGAWVDAGLAYEDAVKRARVAEATLLRWGTP